MSITRSRKADDEAAPQRGHNIAVFRTRRGMLDLWCAIGAFAVLQGIASGIYFWFFASDIETPLLVVTVGLSVALFAFGLYFLTYALGRMRDSEAPIKITPAGLHDRWVSARPIPWESITRLQLVPGGRGGPYIVFDVSEEGIDRAGVWPVRCQIARLSRRMVGYGLRIHHTGTNATPELLVEAIRPYAAIDGA